MDPLPPPDDPRMSFARSLALGKVGADITRIKKTNGIRSVCDFLKITPKEDATRQSLVKVYSRYRALCTNARRLDAVTVELISSIGLPDVTSEWLSSMESTSFNDYKIRIVDGHRVIWSSPQTLGAPITISLESKGWKFDGRDFCCFHCLSRTVEGCQSCVNVNNLKDFSSHQ